MPDLQQFVATPNTGTATLTVGAQTYTLSTASVSCQVTDSATGAVLLDFTGPNAIQWPQVLSTLTAEQAAKVLELLAATLVGLRADQLQGTL